MWPVGIWAPHAVPDVASSAVSPAAFGGIGRIGPLNAQLRHDLLDQAHPCTTVASDVDSGQATLACIFLGTPRKQVRNWNSLGEA